MTFLTILSDLRSFKRRIQITCRNIKKKKLSYIFQIKKLDTWKHFNVVLVNFLLIRLLSCSLPLGRFFQHIRVDKKVRKQNKITKVHQWGIKNVLRCVVAYDKLRAVLHLPSNIVDVAADHHLHELTSGYQLRHNTGHIEPHRLKCIIHVHDGVYEIVHAHEPAAGRLRVLVAVPAVNEHRSVMVPVQKYELLFAENNKKWVHKFGQLA